MYGIWDKPSHGQVASVTTRTTALLLQQTVLAQTTVGSTTVRVVSSNAIDWSTHLGWYMDLPSSSTTGERIVADPFIQTGKLVYQPLIPSTLSCDSGGTSFLMEVDPLTGGRLTFSVFDINGDKNFSSNDFVKIDNVSYPVSGVQTSVGITPKATVIAGGPGKEFKVLSGSTGGLQVVLENPNPASTSSITRRSWRELLRN
jgi:type IV pilus assembly protein PilY1